MTIAVDMGRKATKSNKQTSAKKISMFSTHKMTPEKKVNFSFSFILYTRLTANQLTMLQAES